MFQVLGPSRLIPRKGEFELRFNEQMRPLLLNLRAYFARIPLEIFFRIQGSYAVRFYLFCKSWDPALNRSPGWRMTVEELRAWFGLQPHEYEQTFHIRAAILERAKDELDQVADVSFEYDPVMEGKKIVGWDFVPVPNKPKRTALPGRRRSRKQQQLRLQENEKEAEERHSAFLEDLKAIDQKWLEAGPDQREKWIEAIPPEARLFIPAPGARPSRLFLVALKDVLEPPLPGFS